jgi:putative ABC transport system permease protein
MRKGIRKFLHLPRSSDRIRSDVDDEIRFDLDMRTQALMREGLSHEAARERALAEFGNVEETRAYCEEVDQEVEAEQRRTDRLDELRRDLALAGRTMRRTPGFALVVLLTLALGIGANTTIFSIVRRTLITPLPYRDPAALYRLYTIPTTSQGDDDKLSAIEVSELATATRSIAGVAHFGNYGSLTYTDSRTAEPWQTAQVSVSFFDVLGVAPALGRAFVDDDIIDGAAPVVMLGYSLWQRTFGGDSGVIGRTVQLSDRDHRIIGVLPRAFVGPTFSADALRPLNAPAILRTARMSRARVWRTVVRLREGVTPAALASELTVVHSRVRSEYPELANTGTIRPVPLHEAMLGEGKNVLLLVMAGAVLVLIVTCVNIAGLFLSRATRRRRELSLRVALGASRARLMRQLLSESVLYGLAGGAAGVILAMLLKGAVLELATPSLPNFGDISIDAAVLVFAAAVSIVCGLAFGLMPALAATTGDPRNALVEGGGRSASHGRSDARSSRVLVVAQLALAVVLVVGAGLLVRTFVTMVNTDVGYRGDANALVFRVNLPSTRYANADARRAFLEPFVQRLRLLPGVANAGHTAVAPWNGGLMSVGLRIEGQSTDEVNSAGVEYATASDGFFSALGIPLKEGRVFGASDRAGSTPVLVISESVARRFWPGSNPLGARVVVSDGPTALSDAFEVIGIVGDVRPDVMSERNATVYVTERQWPGNGGEFVVRRDGDAMALVPAITQALRDLDPKLPLIRARPMSEVVQSAAARQRLAMILMGAFAALALVLASLGLYGILAYAVAGRAREFGIRAALGASGSSILGMVFRQGMSTAIIGVAFGMFAAAAVSQYLGSLLVGISAHDTVTFAMAALLLIVVAAIATVLPALAATRVQPVDALRLE